MTTQQLIERLSQHDGSLEVLVRCTWYPDGIGGVPLEPEFYPHTVIREAHPDRDEEIVVIECDQEQ